MAKEPLRSGGAISPSEIKIVNGGECLQMPKIMEMLASSGFGKMALEPLYSRFLGLMLIPP